MNAKCQKLLCWKPVALFFLVIFSEIFFNYENYYLKGIQFHGYRLSGPAKFLDFGSIKFRGFWTKFKFFGHQISSEDKKNNLTTTYENITIQHFVIESFIYPFELQEVC